MAPLPMREAVTPSRPLATSTSSGSLTRSTNTWTPLAPVPDLTNAEASGVYAPNVNKLFVFGGEDITTGHGGQYHAHLRHCHQHLEHWSADA